MMTNRIAQPLVALVRGPKQVKVRATHPAIDIRAGHAVPLEWASRFALIQPVDPYRVVSGRSTEPLSPGTGIDVSEGAGIDQQHLPTNRQLHTQRIGVTMPHPADLAGPGVNHELRGDRFRARHHVNPARLQAKRRDRSLRGRQFLESTYFLDAYKPNSLLSNDTGGGLKVRPVEKHRTCGEGIQQVLDT